MDIKPKNKVNSKETIPTIPVLANPIHFRRNGNAIVAHIPMTDETPTIAPRVDSETHW